VREVIWPEKSHFRFHSLYRI